MLVVCNFTYQSIITPLLSLCCFLKRIFKAWEPYFVGVNDDENDVLSIVSCVLKEDVT